jgi:hypothetical protein
MEQPGGYREASVCTFNCTTDYVCGGAKSLNRGAKGNFPTDDEIVEWTLRTAKAQAIARDMFFQVHFDRHCEVFKLSPSWAKAIRTNRTDPAMKVEANQFGTPEMLPRAPEINSRLKQGGLVVNMTTPGLRFMYNDDFAKRIAANPPHMIAVSVDAVGVDELPLFARMDIDKLKAGLKEVPPMYGERQKAYTGFGTALLMRQMNVATTILFNMVIHEGNVGHFTDILDILEACVPGSLANPYFAQAFPLPNSDFAAVPACWRPEHLPAIEHLVDYFIDRTLNRPKGITSRLHYYRVLKAAFRKWGKSNPERLADFMSGIWAWNQTRRPGAYGYAEIGLYPHFVPDMVQIGNGGANGSKPRKVGGHIGSYWNPVWAYPEQIPVDPQEIAEILLTGVVERGRQFQAMGFGRHICNLMPRLMLGILETEAGLPVELIPDYLAMRLEHDGF